MAIKKEVELYNKEVTIVFHKAPKTHWYTLKGQKERLIGVTSATGKLDKSRALIPWAIRMATNYIRQEVGDKASVLTSELDLLLNQASVEYNKVKDQAAAYGTKVHEFAEAYGKHKLGLAELPDLPDDTPEPVAYGIGAFLDWVNTNTIEFVENEKIMYSKKHTFVGTADCIALVNGKKTLIDYKTSSGIYPEMGMQVSAYYHAYNEEMKFIGGNPVEEAQILQFNKETGALCTKTLTKEDLKKDFQGFLGCLELAKWEKEARKR